MSRDTCHVCDDKSIAPLYERKCEWRFTQYIATSPNPYSYTNQNRNPNTNPNPNQGAKPCPNPNTNLYPNLEFCRNIVRLPLVGLLGLC